MRIGLITAVWRRPAITAVFWRWTAYLRAWWQPHELICFAAGSEPDQEQMAADAGAGWVHVPNQHGVARKFNAALRLAQAAGVDAVLVMGSDDIFCERVARRYRFHLNYGQAYLGLKDCYYYQVRDGRVGYFPGYRRPPHRVGEPTGSGRLVPADLLERLHWQLWEERVQMDKRFPDHGNDHGSFKRVRRLAPHPPLLGVYDLGGTFVSLKSEENLWAFEHTHPLPAPDHQTAADVLGRLPEDLTAEILSWGLVPA